MLRDMTWKDWLAVIGVYAITTLFLWAWFFGTAANLYQ